MRWEQQIMDITAGLNAMIKDNETSLVLVSSLLTLWLGLRTYWLTAASKVRKKKTKERTIKRKRALAPLKMDWIFWLVRSGYIFVIIFNLFLLRFSPFLVQPLTGHQAAFIGVALLQIALISQFWFWMENHIN